MRLLRLAALSIALAPLPAFAQSFANEDASIDAPNPSEVFGASIDLDGDRMLVGRPGAITPGPTTGEASVWERQLDGTWSQVATLAPAALAPGDGFGRGVALDGDLALVGASGDDFGATDAGAVYAFERQTDGTWLETAVLRPNTPIEADGFGFLLDLDGDQAVIGAPNPVLFTFGRAAYVFERQAGGAWLEQSELVASDSMPVDGFGSSLDIEGDRIAVGAPNWFDIAPGTGAVYLYERQPNDTWLEVERVTAGPVLTVTGFGGAVALQDDELAVGNQFERRVHVFRRADATSWPELQVLHDSDPSGSPGFGASLDLDGERLAVGYVGNFFSGLGRIHLFERDGANSWTPSVVLGQLGTASNSTFASAIDLEGDRVVGTQTNAPTVLPAISIFELGTLYHGAPTVSAASGGTHDLLLRAGPARAGDAYALLGSMSGTAPGTTDPVSGLTLPLVFDMYTDLIVNSGGRSVLSPWQGVLDGNGAADATLVVPPATDPALVGLALHHAYFTVKFTPDFTLTSVSNPVRFELVP